MTIKNKDSESPMELGSSAVMSLLRLSQTPRSRPSTYTPEDYVDDSDWNYM